MPRSLLRLLPLGLLASLPLRAEPEPLILHARRRLPGDGPAHLAAVREQELRWAPRRTAVIVCDLWDRHWCRGATDRAAEMAPRVNAFLRAARERGALILHAPSDTMAFYADWPQRQRARQALAAAPAIPAGANRWCALDPAREPPLPIDDTDGGCDDDPPCPQPQGAYPWRRQHPAVEIAPATFAFAPGGVLLAVVFNRFDVRLYEPASGRLVATLSAPFPAQISGVNGLAFSADGRELFAAKQDGEIVAWDLPGLRQGLARLGLDWPDNPGDLPGGTESAAANLNPATSASAVASVPPGRLPAPPAAGGGLWAPLAVTAGAAALLAGVVVFALQRRMLAAYERAATLAEARQRSLVETQLALAQSQKLEALGTLAAGIAHDFNNLLSVIRISNHFVAKAAPADATTRENLAAIEQAVTRGRDLVRPMLGYVRRADDEAGSFSVARVVGDTMGMLSRQFLSGLNLSLELDSACPAVAGSAARLEQMLLNLVVNAAEAMQGNGRLTLAARLVPSAPAGVLAPASSGPCVELSVADDGPGIAPEHLPRVFEPFFTTKHGGAQPGTGLGLSVVYTLARQSGWGLDVSSRPGAGTTFRVYLPVGEQHQSNDLTPARENGRAG